MSKSGAKVSYFLHVAVQQSQFSRDTFKLGGFYSQPNVNLVKDSVQTVVPSFLRTALQRLELCSQSAGRTAQQKALFQLFQGIERLGPAPALASPALHRVFGPLQGQD
ncbi:MAG: hypothetical protein ABL871_13705 [Terricaulis sp.]